MESCFLQSSTMATVSTRFPNDGIRDRSLVFGQSLKFPRLCKQQLARKLKIVYVKAQFSGTPKFSSLSAEAIPGEGDVKDENLAFVAGATGRVGSRTVRELLKLGFRVRAAVRSTQRAEVLVQSVKQMKLDAEDVQAVERLEVIECDLEKPNQIGPALGNASVVLCCIGASEKEVFDITGPYRIDYLATKNLIDAATVANVDHFFMVSSLGTKKVGFPAAILNLFWGVLIWKRKAEEALIASGIPYTIVRPGGMERPTDAFKETHNLFLSEEDTLFGGLVSNLQVAELMAFMAKNRRLSYCKVLEVIAETTAPLTPMDKLLEKIPSQRPLPEELGREDQPGPATKPELTASEVVFPKTSTSPIEPEPIGAKETGTKPLSPYTAYEDLKPPTSPTPTAPDGSIISTASLNEGPDTGNSSPTAAPIAVQDHLAGQKPTPLSPYTMYEDLKPPTTPSPSPRKSS